MPVNYLLDTNAITALSVGLPQATARLSGLDPADEIYTCFVVLGEWEYGVRCAPGAARQTAIRAAGDRIISALTGIWESSPAIAVEYGEVHAQLRAVGRVIPTNDIWIAAAARVNRATVVTSDPHFGRVSGLNVVDWTRP